MAHFFINREDITGKIASIAGEDARHIARSLRMAEGETITLADGSGDIISARLVRIRDEEVLAEIESRSASASESPVDITLFMAYPKSDKLELIVQKSVELGVNLIVPFESRHCIKRPAAEKADKLRQRYNRIAREAACQCVRARLPHVENAVGFLEVLRRSADCDLALFCYEGEGCESIRAILEGHSEAKRIAVIVGSEGGFAAEEALAAREAGLAMTNLGGRILRCETAPLYALSAISYAKEL